MDSLLSTVDQEDLSPRDIEQEDFCTGRHLSEETFVECFILVISNKNDKDYVEYFSFKSFLGQKISLRKVSMKTVSKTK